MACPHIRRPIHIVTAAHNGQAHVFGGLGAETPRELKDKELTEQQRSHCLEMKHCVVGSSQKGSVAGVSSMPVMGHALPSHVEVCFLSTFGNGKVQWQNHRLSGRPEKKKKSQLLIILGWICDVCAS